MLVSVNTRNIGRLMKIQYEHNMSVSEDNPFPMKAEMWVQLKAYNHQYLIYNHIQSSVKNIVYLLQLKMKYKYVKVFNSMHTPSDPYMS